MPIAAQFQQSEMEPWLKDILRSIVERSEFVRKEPYVQYPGQRQAGLNPDILRAYELARVTGDYEPFLRMAQSQVKSGTQEYPEYYERYMNPYQKHVIDNLIHYSGRGFQENILPALESHFVGLGQHGSTKHQTMAQRAARDQQEALNRQIGESLSTGYETSGKLFNADKARQIEAAKLGPELGQAQQAGRLADVSSIGQIGIAQQAHEQKGKDLAYEEFARQQNYPFEALKEQAALVAGTPRDKAIYGVEQRDGNFHNYGDQGNVFGNIGNLAGNLGANAKERRDAYMGHKAGGGIKGQIKKHSFTQTSLYKKPKVGGKTSMKKANDFAKPVFKSGGSTTSEPNEPNEPNDWATWEARNLPPNPLWWLDKLWS